MLSSVEVPQDLRLARPASMSERALWWTSLGTLAVQALALTILFSNWDFDDARIVYRIVDHLLGGNSKDRGTSIR